MNDRSALPLSLLIFFTITITMLFPFSASAETCTKSVAKAVSVQGLVEVKRAGDTRWQPVRLNDTYCTGDTIRVDEKSRADFVLANQPILRLDQGSTVTLKGVKEGRTSVIELIKGAAHFLSRTPRVLEVETAFVSAGVEGTEFFIRVEEDRTLLSIFSGKVLAWNELGKLMLTSGQSAVAESGKAPELIIVVKPRDAVQWTLYYPPTLIPRPSDYRDLPHKAQVLIVQSIHAYGKGDMKGALESISGLPEDLRDPRLFLYRAFLLLGVGRADEAKPDIDKALSLSPQNGDAFALQSIIEITHNEKDKALTLAKMAVVADPMSATTRIALSYAQQANFDLNGALDSVQEATKLSPDNALAWARLSEMWLSFNESKKALSAARRAEALDPNLSRTQTVLGFAYLTEVKIDDSKKAFEKAIELDQTDSLPRLGLGLAKIRTGDLEDGGKEIEIAASLAPNNSLVRSYLGKAYYEEKREKQASEEYRIAKELDPLDPTAYFYDAILKQATNRPVEALHELQNAIELNNNRAVYRSKLLLDADLAARSASLGKIYNDLGFQQRALVEGWRSVDADPADFSGHRFLADTYAVLPRHKIARVSELLQSQLLQPLNITPIQPLLAESDLLLGSRGPTDLSFNEFNPVFNRNRVALMTSSLAGENGTFSEEVVLAAIYNKVSLSVGQYFYETDGFHRNNDLKNSITNVFLQVSPTPQTSIQGEYRYRKIEQGDRTLTFIPDYLRTSNRVDSETNVFRLGLRHDFTPNSTILGSFMYSHQDYGASMRPVGTWLALWDKSIPNSEDFSGEAQYMFRSHYVNLVSGAGYISGNAREHDTQVYRPIFLMDPVVTIRTRDTIDSSAYLYSYIHPLPSVWLTIGASGTLIHSESKYYESRKQFNPKFGVTWNPLPATTVRAAAFRGLRRVFVGKQTLEPTQVAGFNQFYDEWYSTESWRYGLALDQKFYQDFYGGVEFSLRDLSIPNAHTRGTLYTITHEDGKEQFGRAYLFWSPHPWFALTAEYMYERFKNQRDSISTFYRLTTSRIPLGLRFFHPSGLSMVLKGTYFNQNGEFSFFDREGFESGRDNFWTADAAVSYRLPKRYGFISIGATNLFDRHFKYEDTDRGNPIVQPKRFVYFQITLAFP